MKKRTRGEERLGAGTAPGRCHCYSVESGWFSDKASPDTPLGLLKQLPRGVAVLLGSGNPLPDSLP